MLGIINFYLFLPSFPAIVAYTLFSSRLNLLLDIHLYSLFANKKIMFSLWIDTVNLFQMKKRITFIIIIIIIFIE